jgi:hypothetical protein
MNAAGNYIAVKHLIPFKTHILNYETGRPKVSKGASKPTAVPGEDQTNGQFFSPIPSVGSFRAAENRE